MKQGSMRVHAWLALALVAAAPLGAGCLDTASAAWDDVRASTGFPPEEISAKSARDEADAAAREWHADARLVGVHAIEWGPHDAESGRGFNETPFPSDPDVGNGRATAWGFEYVTETERFSVTVRADGSVRDEDRFAADHSQAYAAAGESPEWKIDSDDAIAKLQERSTWRDGARDAQMVMNTLERNGTHSTWAFVAFDAEWRGVIGLVDPATGDVEGVYAWNMSGWDGWSGGNWSWSGNTSHWGEWSWSGGEGRAVFEERYEGTLTRLEPQARHAFPVDAAGHVIRVEYAVRNMPNDAVDVRVLDADGEDVPLDCERPGGAMGAEQVCSARAVDDGEHTLVVALPSTGAYAEYTAHLSVWDGPPARGAWSWSAR